jgi:hypothetical protein
VKHVIEMREQNGRDCWQCDCGHGGTAPAGDGDFHAEKHVDEGDQVSYRYSGSER